jgi:hypothetical protein
MVSQKGQGTIEYLVIIAIVVVIALVVVGLLLQVMGQGSGVPETTAKTAWKSAEPWGITDWDANTTYITVVLKNNSFETMDFNSITIAGVQSLNQQATGVPPGATITKAVAKTCTAATKYSYPKTGIQIDYNSASIAGKTQNAVSDIVGTC